MTQLLAIDAGNTKTIALVARRDGSIIGMARTGCGDIYGATSPEEAVAAIIAAAQAAQHQASVQPGALAGVVLSAAGADWPADFAYLRNAMAEHGLDRNLLVVNDAIGALCAGSPDGTGVVIAVGTGVATGARSAEGRTWHSGFWQLTQGAHAMSGLALKAVYGAELGLAPQTALTEAALAHFGAPDVEALLYGMTRRDSRPTQAEIATFAARLLNAADEGDAVARELVLDQGQALGRYAQIAAGKVGIADRPYSLVLTGGMLRHPSPLLIDAIIAGARASAPNARPLRSQLEPAAGVVLLALAEAGIARNDAIFQRITDTLPGSDFFVT